MKYKVEFAEFRTIEICGKYRNDNLVSNRESR